MSKEIFILLLVLCSILLMVSTAAAEKQNKLHGWIGLGGIAVYDRSESYLKNLDSAPGKKLTTLPMILSEIKYDIGSPGGLKWHLDTKPLIDEAGDFSIISGLSYRFEKILHLQTGIFFSPFENAWKNPYETGIERDSTHTSIMGVKVELKRILESGLKADFVYLNEDVDEDLIGQMTPDLRRDGNVYALSLNYRFYAARFWEFYSHLSIRHGDYAGPSYSFDKYKLAFSAGHAFGALMLLPEMFFSYKGYDRRHPIFDRTRIDHSYGFNLKINYLKPFGLDDWSVKAKLGYGRTDSNIIFFDDECLEFTVFLSYQF